MADPKASWDAVTKEVVIMRQLRHENVVNLHTSFMDRQFLWIVMPLLEGGSVASILKRVAPRGIEDEVLLATLLKMTLQGLAYFHKDAIIHRDVKAGNVLVSGNGEVKLADFGVSGNLVEFGDRKDARQTFVGTTHWMAPEVLEFENGYNTKADVWSFGITALEMAFGRSPYYRFDALKAMVSILRDIPPTSKTYGTSARHVSGSFEDMVHRCLCKDPIKRPTSQVRESGEVQTRIFPSFRLVSAEAQVLQKIKGQ